MLKFEGLPVQLLLLRRHDFQYNGTRQNDTQHTDLYKKSSTCKHRKVYKTRKLMILKVGTELFKFLSSSNDSELYWSSSEIIFPACFTSQGGSIRILQCLDGAR
jgi:hypothetical protein